MLSASVTPLPVVMVDPGKMANVSQGSNRERRREVNRVQNFEESSYLGLNEGEGEREKVKEIGELCTTGSGKPREQPTAGARCLQGFR